MTWMVVTSGAGKYDFPNKARGLVDVKGNPSVGLVVES
jgi:hypothetical protein